MNEFNVMPQEAHRLELVGRERLTVSGVEDVERFDETGIVMSPPPEPWSSPERNCTSASCPWMAGSSMWRGGSTPLPTRTSPPAGAASGAGCSARLWKTISLNSCWCSSSPFCWVWPSGPSMICCGPSASGCPGWPRCWTAYMPWPWGRGAFASSWPGRRENCGDLWCWESWAAPCCFFPPSPPCCGRCGNFGRIPWAVWSAA